MKKRRTIKEYFSDKTDKEIFAILLFFSCIILMVVLAVFRFCGIGYFANTYSEHKLVPWVQVAIQFVLKWVDLLFVLLILSKARFYIITVISLAWTCIYFIAMPESIVMVLDILYATILPFVLDRFDYKRITYGLLLFVLISIYQFIMLQARYTIDLSLKFNYMALIVSVFDYKIFLLSLYLITKFLWRKYESMELIKTPNPEEEKNWSGGGCIFFFGKFEKACEVIGKIIVGVCTLGIAPLSVHLYRKAKAKKVQPAEPETQDEKTE